MRTGRNLGLAVGQMPAGLATTQDRLDWLATILPEVASKGADLLLLPELFASGYNIGHRHADLAEPADGPTAGRIAALAVQYGLAIHYSRKPRNVSRN